MTTKYFTFYINVMKKIEIAKMFDASYTWKDHEAIDIIIDQMEKHICGVINGIIEETKKYYEKEKAGIKTITYEDFLKELIDENKRRKAKKDKKNMEEKKWNTD